MKTIVFECFPGHVPPSEFCKPNPDLKTYGLSDTILFMVCFVTFGFVLGLIATDH